MLVGHNVSTLPKYNPMDLIQKVHKLQLSYSTHILSSFLISFYTCEFVTVGIANFANTKSMGKVKF